MNRKWYEVKLRYEKVMEDGTPKKVLESYMVDAVSFADAEGRITSVMADNIVGEFEVDAAKKNNVSEVVYGEGSWYLAKVALVAIDEKTGAEKAKAASIYICADGFDAACARIKEHMHDTMSDWYVMSLSETNIIEIYPLDDNGTAQED